MVILILQRHYFPCCLSMVYRLFSLLFVTVLLYEQNGCVGALFQAGTKMLEDAG